jgi:tetratricopeptide (TPR) repeat protein
MGWLIEQVGLDHLRRAAVILPTEAFFPEPYAGAEDDAQVLLRRVSQYLEVASQGVTVAFYDDVIPVVFDGGRRDGSPAGGLESKGEDASPADADPPSRLWIERCHLGNPEIVVARIAHELAVAMLHESGCVETDCRDWRCLADLATVAFGLGVFTANDAVTEVTRPVGCSAAAQVRHNAYLTPELFGYALALFAWVRGEEEPAWAGYLCPEVREPFDRSRRYLAESGKSRTPAAISESSGPPSATPNEIAECDGASRGCDEFGDPELAIEPNSADGCATRGVLCLENGRYDEAVAEFTEAIRLSGEDAELFIMRGAALVHLERREEALRDADAAAAIEPENQEAAALREKAMSLPHGQLASGASPRAVALPSHRSGWLLRVMILAILSAFALLVIAAAKWF